MCEQDTEWHRAVQHLQLDETITGRDHVHQVQKLQVFGLSKKQAMQTNYHSFERGCWLLPLP